LMPARGVLLIARVYEPDPFVSSDTIGRS